jgi:hypothetical protein
MEGYKAVSVSNTVYDELMATVEKAKAVPIARQKDTGPSGCGLVVVVKPGPNGPTIDSGCGGGCGFIDWILGRSCQMAGATTDVGVDTWCSCSGGWFDRIFR